MHDLFAVTCISDPWPIYSPKGSITVKVWPRKQWVLQYPTHIRCTLLSHPATMGNWEYSSGIFREVRGVSNKFSASDPCGSETSGIVLVGVGSNKDMSDDTCGAITCMVCCNWGGEGREGCLSVGIETGSSKLRPSKSVLKGYKTYMYMYTYDIDTRVGWPTSPNRLQVQFWSCI